MHHETSRRRTLRSSARIKSIRTPSAARFMAKPSQRFLATNKFGGKMVGAWRFELQTSCAQGRRATRLRYAPTLRVFILAYLAR
jgi:hypothetical protein